MIEYLTIEHTYPAPNIVINGSKYPVSVLISRNDIAKLLEGGVYRHISEDGNAPLGYSNWVQSSDQDGTYFSRTLNGTLEERNTARITQLRQKLTLQAYEIASNECDNNAGLYSPYEAARWTKLLDESKQYIDNGIVEPFIYNASTDSPEPPGAFTASVLVKSQAYENELSNIIKTRNIRCNIINNATLAELEALEINGFN